MPIPNFETVTSELITHLTTDVGASVDQILDYPPLALEGNSPILSLHDDGTQPYDGTWRRWWVTYRLTVFINRETGADAAETLLRTIRKAVLESLESHIIGTNYHSLELTQKTAPAMDVLDGVNYRNEEIFFRVFVSC